MTKEEIIAALKELRELKEQIFNRFDHRAFSKHLNNFIKTLDDKILELVNRL
ncbi:MAG: hypothetical protein ACTSQP_24575 [Promethearchaeota archaeon]